MLRRRAGVLAAVLAVLLLTACGGGGDDGSEDAEAILREYALTARDLVNDWPPPQAAPEIARLSLDAQRPRVDSVNRLAERAQALADDAKGDRAAAYAALAKGITATHADLERKLGVIGRDEYWALDFYCGGLDETLAAARQQAAAVDGVIAVLEIDSPPDLLSRDGGALATAARCRDAVNEAATPLASTAGGFTEGMDERAEHVRAAYGAAAGDAAGLRVRPGPRDRGTRRPAQARRQRRPALRRGPRVPPRRRPERRGVRRGLQRGQPGRARRPEDDRRGVAAGLAAHRRRRSARGS